MHGLHGKQDLLSHLIQGVSGSGASYRSHQNVNQK